MAKPSKAKKSLEVNEVSRQIDDLAIQFVSEGKLSLDQANEIASIEDSDEARERFLELVKERHEGDRLEVADNLGHGRMGDEGFDKYLA